MTCTHTGSGLCPTTSGALVAMMHRIVPAMFKAQEPWAVIGSVASVMQGIPEYVPPDIDLATTSAGAYIMEGCIGSDDTMVRPVSYSVSPPYASHFGRFEVDGVPVEVMGDLVIECPDGTIDLRDHWPWWSNRVRVCYLDGLHIPVAPLEWQLIANTLLNRPERVKPITGLLLSRGYNPAFLETLLNDERLTLRAVSRVREAMHLDA